MKCSEAEEGAHEYCCFHELPASSRHAPGRICCWCGDVYQPLYDEGSEHGEYFPRVFKEQLSGKAERKKPRKVVR